MTTYLDHASTSWPKAPGVGEAMARALDLAGSSHRGSSRGSREAGSIDDRVRGELARTIHATEARRVVLTSGATESLNLAILGVVRAAHAAGIARPRVVTTQIEHNAVRRPLAALAALGQIELEVVPASQDTRVSPLLVLAEAGASASRPAARLVVMTWASNVTGAMQAVEEVAGGLRRTPTLLLVDGSQSVGLVRSSAALDEVGIDLLAFSAHKALAGPAGVGGLYVGPRAHPLVLSERAQAALIAPVLLGGTGSESASPEMPVALPGRFEPGTPNTPARAGLLAALGHVGPGASALAHARALVEGLRGELERLARVRLLGSAGPGVGILAFQVEGLAPDEAAVVLETEFGITLRAGLHCAPGAHEAMGTLEAGGCLRASVGATSTWEGIEALVRAVRAIARA